MSLISGRLTQNGVSLLKFRVFCRIGWPCGLSVLQLNLQGPYVPLVPPMCSGQCRVKSGKR
jgi:hypothetical protein